MSWSDNTRYQYNRRKQRYLSACIDGEWQVVQPFLARSCKVGHPRKHYERDICNAIQYIANTAYHWNHLTPIAFLAIYASPLNCQYIMINSRKTKA